jgi:hypothetical protein
MTTDPKLTLYSVTLPWNRNDPDEGDYCDSVWAGGRMEAVRLIAEQMADTKDESFNSDEDRQEFIENLVNYGGECWRVEDRILNDIRNLLGGPTGTLTQNAENDLEKVAQIMAAHSPAPPEAPVKESFTDPVARLHHAVVAAQEQFWTAIAKHYPEIKTGDFPPDAAHQFDVACMVAASTWVDSNYQAEQPAPRPKG